MNHAHIRELVFRLLLFALAIFGATTSARAENAAFDLAGPQVEMTVNRAGKTLPIAEVPNLQAGDRLWIHPVLPEDQSVRYLLVVAFLRGTTNPPPDEWFTRAETWNKNVHAEGIVVTVPQDAQQALLFLAPTTGGDFDTLRSAVRSRPGLFVRASQDLNQASLDRTRSDKYLYEVKSTSNFDPKALHDRSVLLAKTLGIRLEEQCFDRPPEQQSTCLTQNTDQLVLDDGHSESMVAALTSGPSTDLMGKVTATPFMGAGFYSPYVGAVVDVAKLLSSLHTASYQYIPALSVPQGAQVNLRLNNPPSFRKPMSVIVMGLPAVEAAQLPPLRSLNKDGVFCLQKAPLVLPVEGAPVGLLDRHRTRFCAAPAGQSRSSSGFARGTGSGTRRLSGRRACPERRQPRSRCEGDRSRILGIRLVRRARFSDGQCAFRNVGDSGRGSGRIDCGQGRRSFTPIQTLRHASIRFASRTSGEPTSRLPGQPSNRMNWKYTFRSMTRQQGH